MQTEAPLYDVLNYLPEGILMVDERGVILFANEAFSEMVGYENDILLGLNILSLLADIDVFTACIAKVMNEGKSLDAETDFLHSDGRIIQAIKSVRMIRHNEHIRFFVNIRNLSDINRLNKELRLSKELIEYQAHELSTLLNSKNQELEEILGSIDEVIWYIDNQTLSLRYVNNAVEGVFGFTKETFLADPSLWQQQIYPDDRELVKMFFETLRPGQSQEIRFRILRNDGESRWLNSRIHHHPTLKLFIGITSDITSSKTQSDEIAFLAYHDPLTLLPNRAKLKLQLENRFEHSSSTPFALLFLDLDNFKNINDTMGHEVGDKILIEVSRRILATAGEHDFCARFGGDEFVVLLQDTDISHVNMFAERMIQMFKRPFRVKEIDFFLSTSIGIVLYPQDAQNGEDLIKHADTAMYEAKNKGKNQFVYYHSSMQRAIHNFLYIESLVRDGLRQNLFELYFQPLIDSKTLRLEGYEALMRLPHPTEGFVSPDIFITVAETNGDILLIGEVVLRQACDFITSVRQLCSQPFFVAINISSKQLHQMHFAQDLLDYLKERDIPPSFLKVELTESAVMENIDIAAVQLNKLKEGGVRIALDDFGTGYSSFAYLAQLPIDTLKIDKSFILTLFEVNSNRHIVEAMSNLAHVLGMSVTAEGVEESEHFDFLIQNKIDTLQGYHLSRPLPRNVILQKLQNSDPYFTPLPL
ncbi:GGDEF and EAL domain-containing protein [Sulfuricurvum sp.]|uniref:sensor domain-containing protein n=1 Tax=Sulfuricurvum sp. TaxID=2025608 RepID=UPI002616C810|nr:GGDEF and EAL domain-containing protein [Sulfuricurvum sp.]MDD2265441.1 EAL domain-containing protein [Sulfuricurvum sp.]MDD2782901.1 EAL domain-containing protein [Sulfuricurvum sp.]